MNRLDRGDPSDDHRKRCVGHRYDPFVTAPPTSRIVGRDAELEVARHLTWELAAGSGAMLLVHGEAGIGKSRVVDAVASDADALGIEVFRGAAHPFERTRPFGVVADALGLSRRSADPHRAAIGQLLIGDDEPATTTLGGVADLRHRIVEDIVDLVETAAGQGPVMLVLEDLHWTDGASLLAARALSRRLNHVPFSLIASLRPSPRSAELDQSLDDAAEIGAHLLRLAALSSDEVDRLALDQLGAPPGPLLTRALANAGGHPLWVVELLRSLTAERLLLRAEGMVEVTSSELPGSLREVVLRRLRHLSEPTLDLLRQAAVLGDAARIQDLVSVARRPSSDVVDQLTEAFRAGLLEERGDAVVFRHQLVHDAIYQDMPSPARQVLHRGAARALADAGADLLQVADQLVLGARRGDLEAVGWLRRGAREAGARDPATAVELLTRAESLLPGGHDDADLISAELVEALLRAGRVAESTARAEAVLDRRHRPDVDSSLRLGLLSALSLQNRPWELIERTEATLASANGLSVADQSLVLAQASWGRTFSATWSGARPPPAARSSTPSDAATSR